MKWIPTKVKAIFEVEVTVLVRSDASAAERNDAIARGVGRVSREVHALPDCQIRRVSVPHPVRPAPPTTNGHR